MGSGSSPIIAYETSKKTPPETSFHLPVTKSFQSFALLCFEIMHVLKLRHKATFKIRLFSARKISARACCGCGRTPTIRPHPEAPFIQCAGFERTWRPTLNLKPELRNKH